METKNAIEVLSKSSSGDPYTVRFYIDQDSVSVSCSCRAGKHRKLCKHVIGLMSGDDSILYDMGQKTTLDEICSRLQETKIPLLLSELNESETILKDAQKNVEMAKKNMAKAVIHR